MASEVLRGLPQKHSLSRDGENRTNSGRREPSAESLGRVHCLRPHPTPHRQIDETSLLLVSEARSGAAKKTHCGQPGLTAPRSAPRCGPGERQGAREQGSSYLNTRD